MIRVVFMGSSAFSLPAVDVLAEAEDVDLAAVVTQPDRPRGRNRRIQPGPVHARATDLGVPVQMPGRVGDPEAVAALAALVPDVLLVASYGQFIPRAVRELPRLGILNIHPSLLPQYRGAAPMQWAIANGDTGTGVTIFHIERAMDAGDIVVQEPCPILPEDTGVSLERTLSRQGARLGLAAIRMLAAGTAPRVPQDHAAATYAPKLTKEQGVLDWTLPATVLHNRVRGYQPWPGCATLREGRRLGVWTSRVVRAQGEPGRVVRVDREGPVVAAGRDSLQLIEVQPEGKPRMAADAYLRGHPLRPGDRLGDVPPQGGPSAGTSAIR